MCFVFLNYLQCFCFGNAKPIILNYLLENEIGKTFYCIVQLAYLRIQQQNVPTHYFSCQTELLEPVILVNDKQIESHVIYTMKYRTQYIKFVILNDSATDCFYTIYIFYFLIDNWHNVIINRLVFFVINYLM